MITFSAGDFLALALGYVLGAIPFGLLLTRFFGAGDLRAIGSGNIGATNVLRTGRKDLAAATLLLDALKGSVAVWLGAHLGGEDGGLAGAVGAFLGHLYPLWLKFRGGKGVATYLGAIAAYAWPAGLVFAVVWLAVAFATRWSSAGALAASAAAALSLALGFGRFVSAEAFALLAALLWIKHASNIKRLLDGSEPKIGVKGSR